ncbi:RING-H2 finger protein ATL29 [Cicer arietinum]|uniref:RING-type E3 ubiquitin transferase n=1 Tax=Cicer arietinum TaxID=3827 RepID=A0A1S2YTP1_CICAR|nr:RING-H2 finger protein ATL29 [Cicer arietinum]
MSSAEPDYDVPPASAYSTPPTLVAFTLTVLILCFVAFSIVYLCKYCFSNVFHTWDLQRTASGTIIRPSPARSPPRGLDVTLLNRFPTFVYASVKNLRLKKSYSLECAICLTEFEDDSLLRLLTICCHVFHQECIDLWLRSHKTCPVCRTELDSPPNQTSKHGDDNSTRNAQEDTLSLPCDDIRIDVREEENGGVGEMTRDHIHEGDQHDHHMSMQQQEEEHKFARSHSTGHSILMIRGGEERDDDKYTLILPEHVIRAGHYCTRSCVSYHEIRMAETAPCSNCGFVNPKSDSTLLTQGQES